MDRRLASKLPSGEAKIRGCEDQAGPNQELEARGTEWGEPWECGASRWGRSLWRRAPHREEAERGVGAARGTRHLRAQPPALPGLSQELSKCSDARRAVPAATGVRPQGRAEHCSSQVGGRSFSFCRV